MIIKLLSASIGALGFGLLFNTKKSRLPFVFLGGFINIVSYEITYKYTNNIFLSSAVCASVIYIYSNIIARIIKCPSVIFVLTGLIPVVPGAALFYMMQNIVLSNNSLAIKYGLSALYTVLGIAFGIALFSMFLNIFRNTHNSLKK